MSITEANVRAGSPFLLIEDHADAARALARLLRKYRDTIVVATVAEGLAALATGRFCGIIADASLPDGSGIDVVARARTLAEHAAVPAMILTGLDDPALSRQALRHGAFFGRKPIGRLELQPFVDAALLHDHVSDADLRHALITLQLRHELTEREVLIVALAAQGFGRDRIAEMVELQPSGYRSAVRRILAKVDGCASLAQVAHRALRLAMLRE